MEDNSIALCCPSCGGQLIYKRLSDGVSMREIGTDSSIKVLSDTKNINEYVMCSIQQSHNIPEQLRNKVIALVGQEAARKKIEIINT